MIENPSVGMTVWYVNNGESSWFGEYEIMQSTIQAERGIAYCLDEEPSTFYCTIRHSWEMWESRQEAVAALRKRLGKEIAEITERLGVIVEALKNLENETSDSGAVR